MIHVNFHVYLYGYDVMLDAFTVELWSTKNWAIKSKSIFNGPSNGHKWTDPSLVGRIEIRTGRIFGMTCTTETNLLK